MSLPASASSLSSLGSLTWVDRPGRALLRLAWPITISMVSFSTMTLASTAFVAHLGADPLAGARPARRDPVPSLLGAAVALAIGFGVLAVIAGQLVAPLLVHLTGSPDAGR